MMFRRWPVGGLCGHRQRSTGQIRASPVARVLWDPADEQSRWWDFRHQAARDMIATPNGNAPNPIRMLVITAAEPSEILTLVAARTGSVGTSPRSV